MRPRLIPVVALVLAVAMPARAQLTQSPEYQINGLRAILLTPAAALPQLVPITERGKGLGSGVAGRLGRYNFLTANHTNVAASAWLGIGGRLQVGGTFGQQTCEGCTSHEGAWIGSVDVNATVLHKSGKRSTDADTDVGLQVSAGMGKAKVSDFRAISIFVAAPIGVTLPQSNESKFSLFVSPGFAYGRLMSADSTIGALPRVVMGAGAAMRFPGGLGAHLSAHRVITGDSPTQLGGGLSWTFGRRRSDEAR